MTLPITGRGPQMNGVFGLFFALSTLAIILRCYCRAFIVKSFAVDDWFAVIAWLLFTCFCAFGITAVSHGAGQHVAALPPAEIPIAVRWSWACELVYVLSNMALKFSIALFLLRIAVARIHKTIIWTTVALVEMFSAFYFFVFLLQCRPLDYFWTRFTGGQGTCTNPKFVVDATYGYSAVSCVVDWTLSIVPVFLIWNLQMNPRTKLVVAMILAVGAIASIATIVRIPYVKHLANTTDVLYDNTGVTIWSTAETGIGITASACATLRPLFRSFFSRNHLMGSTTTPTSGTPWPKSGSASGYARQKDSRKGMPEEFDLRDDIGRNRGVTTTVVGSGSGSGSGGGSGGGHELDLERNGGKGQWNNSVSKLTELSSDEDEGQAWRKGIRKTTVSTQVVH